MKMFLVLGNITVDEAMPAERWPAPGETVVVGSPRRDPGGKGANQALSLKRAGATVRLVAAIGEDDLGHWAEAALEAEGLERSALIRLHQPTDRSLIFVSPEGENMIASVVGCAAAITPAQAVGALGGMTAGDVLVLQGNLTLATTTAACVEARRRGRRVVFNPSPMRDGFAALLPLIDLLVVNAGEAVQLAGGTDGTSLLERLAEAGAGTVVVTRGGRGAEAFGRAGTARVEAEPVAAIDTTGAGDTFTGVLAAALYARALPMDRAMRAASAAAALTVTRPGTWSAFPTAAEVAAILAGS